MKRIKNIVLISLTALIIVTGAVWVFFKTPDTYSLSERRTLAQKPVYSAENLLSGRFMTDFEDYMLDQFPLRDAFRSVKAFTSLRVFRQKANHDLYTVNGCLSKLEYPENPEKIELSISKLRDVYDQYIAGTACRTYLSIIPDKNYYLAPLGGYPVMDYGKVTAQIRNGLDFASYIDIFDLLTLEDYYNTDQHWRQEKIVGVAEALADAMQTQITTEFQQNKLDIPLYGAYVGQSALPFDGDALIYLTNDVIDGAVVTGYGTGKPAAGVVYDVAKAAGKDAYDLFLSGAEPLLTIENPAAATDRELVIFRDSFSGSLAPLLLSGYSKITLVDLRYMRSDVLGQFVQFNGQDVLFLYSTLVFNNSVGM